MSNVIYDDEMYNEETKNKYLSLFKPGTKKLLERIFKISCPIEKELEKDLYSFGREDLRRLFYLCMPSTPSASKGNVSYVQKYIQWAIDNGLKKGLNPLDTVDTEWKEQFVIKQVKRFWTEDEIDEMLNPKNLVNAQDRVIIALLFEGVKGQENAEITNLRYRDVDFTNGVLSLTDEDGSKREIEVSQKCLAAIQNALSENDYVKRNGKPSVDIRSEKANLIENDYVVRSAHTRTINFEDADKNIVYRRLKIVAEEFEESNLTPTNIFYSGMLAYAKRLLVERGKLGKEEYEEISRRFNVSQAVIQRLKTEFLNVQFIRNMYGLKS
jgi:integrase